MFTSQPQAAGNTGTAAADIMVKAIMPILVPMLLSRTILQRIHQIPPFQVSSSWP